ncbi:MAG: hypothetical protein FWG91_05690 [Lachnospiraceae bacterium]|nr:hypothetical protein [Lachnospiraceae bacterium]
MDKMTFRQIQLEHLSEVMVEYQKYLNELVCLMGDSSPLSFMMEYRNFTNDELVHLAIQNYIESLKKDIREIESLLMERDKTN